MNLKKKLQALMDDGLHYSDQISLFQSRLYEDFNIIVELAEIEIALEDMWLEQKFEHEQQIKYYSCTQTEKLLSTHCVSIN